MENTNSTRTPIIAGNWKMNHGIAESMSFLSGLNDIQIPADREVLLFPPYLSLHTFHEFFKNSAIAGVKYGAQNMHMEESGAYTGEVSSAMLHDVGCSAVLIGHSERRQYFNETDESVNAKVRVALTNDLTPIICVGENLDIRKANNHLQHVAAQVTAALNNVDKNDYSKLVFAYEPIWAIGTGETASPEQAQEVHATIREIVGDEVRVLYGGSVKPANCTELMAMPDIDGALVGGASLEVDSFGQIINY